MLIVRIVALVVGYCFGLIQTGYIFGKFNKIDIRDYGSGNSGATNALRVMGKKAGLIVLLGDFFKAFIPCLAFRLIFRNSEQINNILLLLYCGLGVVLGHSFPAHLGFRGGKVNMWGVGRCPAGDIIPATTIYRVSCTKTPQRIVSFGVAT